MGVIPSGNVATWTKAGTSTHGMSYRFVWAAIDFLVSGSNVSFTFKVTNTTISAGGAADAATAHIKVTSPNGTVQSASFQFGRRYNAASYARDIVDPYFETLTAAQKKRSVTLPLEKGTYRIEYYLTTSKKFLSKKIIKTASEIRVKVGDDFISIDDVKIGGVVPAATKVKNNNNEWVEV